VYSSKHDCRIMNKLPTYSCDCTHNSCSCSVPPKLPALADRVGDIYDLLVHETAAAIKQAGYAHVTLGISGGLDSALVATIAADALLKSDLPVSNLHGVIMPSQWTAQQSVDDAQDLASRLQIESLTINIVPTLNILSSSLESAFAGKSADVTEENMQARIRAVILMALSNKHDWLVLCTGNLSESLVGYSTLYGDTVGAFAPLAPIYKTWAYELAEYRNGRAREAGKTEPIPRAIIEKAPSAELAPGQTDEAALGPYDQLDALLFAAYNLHRDSPVDETGLIGLGFDGDFVRSTLARIRDSEFKRQQACPGAVLPDIF